MSESRPYDDKVKLRNGWRKLVFAMYQMQLPRGADNKKNNPQSDHFYKSIRISKSAARLAEKNSNIISRNLFIKMASGLGIEPIALESKIGTEIAPSNILSRKIIFDAQNKEEPLLFGSNCPNYELAAIIYRYKRENGPLLTRIAKEYHEQADLTPDFPLISRPDWLPDFLIPLADVDKKLKNEAAWDETQIPAPGLKLDIFGGRSCFEWMQASPSISFLSSP